jgi:hypothetical protein
VDASVGGRKYDIMTSIDFKRLMMVTIKHEELIEQLEVLPVDIKTQLVEKLLSSIMPPSQSIDTLWIDEANKRLNEIKSQTVRPVDGDEVFRKIAKRLHT